MQIDAISIFYHDFYYTNQEKEINANNYKKLKKIVTDSK